MFALALCFALAPQDDIGKLIEQLGDEQLEVRERARERLLASGDRAVPALEKAADHANPEVRIQAKEILRKFNERRDRLRLVVPAVRRRWLARDFVCVERMVRTAFGPESVESVRYVPAKEINDVLTAEIAGRLGKEDGTAFVGSHVFFSLPPMDSKWESTLAVAAPRITLGLKEAKLADAVAEIQKRAEGRKLVLDDASVPDDYRIDLFEARDAPWTDALDALVEKCGLAIDASGPDVVRLARPVRGTFAVKDADIKSIVDLLRRISRVEIDLPQGLSGRVTISVMDDPWYDALQQAVAKLGDYEVVREGVAKCRVLTPDETAARRILHRDGWSAYVVVRMK